MARVLAFPFKLNAAGHAATVEQESTTYYSQQLASILLTVQNEREYVLEFGMPDMAFEGFMHSSFKNQVTEYLPNLSDVSADITEITSTTQKINISFQNGDD